MGEGEASANFALREPIQALIVTASIAYASHAFMLRSSLVALAFLFASAAAAQPFDAYVYLHSASDRAVVIGEVTSFGFYLDGGQGLLYRQIDSLQTRDMGLTESIQSALPTARIEAQGNTFMVHIDRSAVRRHRPSSSNRIVEEIGVIAGAIVGERFGATTAVQVGPRGAGPLFAAIHLRSGGA